MPAVVIAVLFAPGLIPTRRLNMTTRCRAYPDVFPRRRNGQCLDPLARPRRAERLSFSRQVGKPSATAPSAITFLIAVDVDETSAPGAPGAALFLRWRICSRHRSPLRSDSAQRCLDHHPRAHLIECTVNPTTVLTTSVQHDNAGTLAVSRNTQCPLREMPRKNPCLGMIAPR